MLVGKRKLYWAIAAGVYFYAAFCVLWNFAPPYPGDGYGSGFTPSLILPGLRLPSVSWREYLLNPYTRFHYRIPYFVIALVFTLLGAIAPSCFLRRFPGLGAHAFATSTLIGLVLLLIAPA